MTCPGPWGSDRRIRARARQSLVRGPRKVAGRDTIPWLVVWGVGVCWVCWGLVALGLFGVVGEVGDDADQVVGGGGLGGGDGALDGSPLALAGGAVPGGPGRGQGGGDAGGGVLVVVGDGLVGVGGAWVGGGCGGAVSPAPGVGGGVNSTSMGVPRMVVVW